PTGKPTIPPQIHYLLAAVGATQEAVTNLRTIRARRAEALQESIERAWVGRRSAQLSAILVVAHDRRSRRQQRAFLCDSRRALANRGVPPGGIGLEKGREIS